MDLNAAQRCNSQEGQWRVSRAPLNMNGIQTHSKMNSPAEWTISNAQLKWNTIQTHHVEDAIFIRVNGEFHALHITWRGFKRIWRCIPQLGGEFRTLHLVLVYFHVPRLRLVNELGASVPFVGNDATQVARVSCVQPLETWVQRVATW